MAETQSTGSPPIWSRGLFVPMEGAAAEQPAANVALLRTHGGSYNILPFLGAVSEIGATVSAFNRNPYDPRALVRMQQMATGLMPHLKQARGHANPVVRQALAPMVQGMSSFLANSQKLLAMRLRTSHQIARAPKILVPISLQIAAGNSTTGIQIRNPYLGASGGAANPYQVAWAITSFRTSNNENGQLQAIRITDWTFGGHNFVAASLGGISYTAGGAPATQGWPAATFAESQRKNWKTEVQPWNVIAQHGGATGFGSIMTETGYLQIAVFNGGTGTFVDTWPVFVNATLCGSPFTSKEWTQADLMRKSFAPLNLQIPLAMKIANDASKWVISGVNKDDESVTDNPYAWTLRMDGVWREIEGMLEHPEHTMMGEPIGYPGDFGISPDFGQQQGSGLSLA